MGRSAASPACRFQLPVSALPCQAIGGSARCSAHWRSSFRSADFRAFGVFCPRNGGCGSPATGCSAAQLTSQIDISCDLIRWKTLQLFSFLVFSSDDECPERQVGYCLPCFTRRVLSSLTSSQRGAADTAAESCSCLANRGACSLAVPAASSTYASGGYQGTGYRVRGGAASSAKVLSKSFASELRCCGLGSQPRSQHSCGIYCGVRQLLSFYLCSCEWLSIQPLAIDAFF